MRYLILAATALATAAHAQSDPQMGADDPAKFHAALEAMGFAPEALDMSGAPSTTITSQGDTYWVVLGGCNDAKKACKTVMAGARYNDVVNPPLAWINKQNESYDLLKVWLNKAGELSYSVQAPAAGMTRQNFRALIDGLNQSSARLAQDALEAKLNKE